MGQNPFYGTVHNPAAPGQDDRRLELGQRGGARGGPRATSALGTDTGCSIRLPSACCETVGLKPRWGSIGMEGVFPLCPTLDTVGPMARTRRGRGARLVGAQGRAGARAAARRADASGCCGSRRRSATAARPRRATSPRAGRPTSQRLGRARRRGASAGAVREHVAAVQPRGARSRTGRRSRRGRTEYSDVCRTKLESALDDDGRRGRGGVPRARGVAPLRAGGRPLRRARATRRSCRPRTPTSSRCACGSRSSCAGST